MISKYKLKVKHTQKHPFNHKLAINKLKKPKNILFKAWSIVDSRKSPNDLANKK